MAFTLNPFTGRFDYYVAGITTAEGDARWLKLDCSNDPLTETLELEKNLELLDTTTSELGVVTKDGDSFLHNFHHPTGSTAIPTGRNLFLGIGCGNFTMGSTATSVSHGSYNIGFGVDCLSSLTTGMQNTMFGDRSGYAITTGQGNTGFGWNTCQAITTGRWNTGVGFGTCRFVTGEGNTGVGYQSLGSLQSAIRNVGIGMYAGSNIATGASRYSGDKGIYIGYYSRASADGVDNEIVIGESAIGKGANTTIIGTASHVATYLPNDSHKLYFGAAGDMSLEYDGTVGLIDTSLIAASDLDIDCGAGKTLRLVEPVYDDQQVNLGTVGKGSSAPTDQAYKGGEVLSFANAQSNEITFTMQLSHKYKTSGTIEFHVHTIAPDNNSGDVEWQFTYSLADIGDDFPAETTTTATQTIAANSQDEHLYFDLGALGSTSDGVSALAICSLTRLGSDANDTYANDVYLAALDFHIPIDTIGSRQEAAK